MKKTTFYILFIIFFKGTIAFTQDSTSTKKNRKFLYGLNVSASVSHYVGGIANISASVTSNTKCKRQ